jgi:tetratricopeptide (TPR) repeat protein
VGGFTLEATEGVCNPENDLDVFSGVETLLNNNLLRQVDSSFNEARFDMLQTMREYASEKLEEFGEMETIRRSHALYFARKAEEMGEKIFGRHAVTWLKRIDEEHDNLRAVLSWGLETKDGIELAVRICAGLTWFWYRYGHFHEGREWSERALVAAEGTGDPSLRALALGAVALMAMWEGDLHVAAQLGEEAVQVHEQLKDDATLAVAKMSYGVILLNQGKDKEAYPQLVQAAELYDQEGQPWWKSTVLVHLGNVSLGLGEFEQAKRWLDEAMPVINEIGDQWQIAFGLNNYGEVARAQGNYAEAEKYYRKTEAYYQEADALSDQARLVHTFGYLAQHKGEYEKAQALFAESLKQFRELGNKRGMIECLAGLTSLASELGEHEWAAPLLSAAQAQLTSFGGAWWPADRVEFEATLARLQSALDEQSLELLWTGGRGMSLEQAIAYANANLR